MTFLVSKLHELWLGCFFPDLYKFSQSLNSLHFLAEPIATNTIFNCVGRKAVARCLKVGEACYLFVVDHEPAS